MENGIKSGKKSTVYGTFNLFTDICSNRCDQPIIPDDGMEHGREIRFSLTILFGLLFYGSTTAADFDLVQTFHPRDTPTFFQSSGDIRSTTLQDRNGNSVTVDVHHQGNVSARATGTKEAGNSRRTAFETGPANDAYRLTLSGDRGGTVTSEVIYTFRSPEGEVFDGYFRMDARIAAWKLFSNASSSVRIEYKFGHSWYWRDLAHVTAPEKAKEARLANTLDTFDASEKLLFDATGHRTVSVRLVLTSSFFPDNAQVYRVRFRGRTADADSVQVLQNESRPRTTDRKTTYNLLRTADRWAGSQHPEQVGLNWTKTGMNVVAGQSSGTVFYRRRLPVQGGRISTTLQFDGASGKKTGGGLLLDGIRTDGGETLQVLVFPEQEKMQLGNKTVSYDRLPENPYRYELTLRFQKKRARLYWGGRKMTSTPVTFVRPETSIGARVIEGTVRYTMLTARGGISNDARVASPNDRLDVQLDVSEDRAISLPSPWPTYWGTHYEALNNERAVEDLNVRFSAVRGYGGPSMGFGTGSDREDSPTREGPFTGDTVRLSLDDYRRRNRWANPDDSTAADYMPQIAGHDVRTVWNLSMTDDSEKHLPYVQRDLHYWFLTLIYDRWPSVRDKLIWQIGNELVSSHWNPKGVTDSDDGREKPPELPDRKWKNGYDLRWKLDFYINEWFGPAVETTERVGREVFGNRDALPVAAGSVNPYNEENAWFLDRFMQSSFGGEVHPTLQGDPVWKHLDYLTIHYMFDVGTPNHRHGGNRYRRRMDRYVRDYLVPGKVKGIWVTEAHGRAGRGPVTILRTGFRFLDWVADHRLSAEQAKLFWWGEGKRSGGSGKEMARRLGRFFQERELSYALQPGKNAAIYALTGKSGDGTDRIVVAVVPPRNGDPANIGTIHLSGGKINGERWRTRAMQYSVLSLPESVPVKGTPNDTGWAITLNRRVFEPLVIWLKR